MAPSGSSCFLAVGGKGRGQEGQIRRRRSECMHGRRSGISEASHRCAHPSHCSTCSRYQRPPRPHHRPPRSRSRSPAMRVADLNSRGVSIVPEANLPPNQCKDSPHRPHHPSGTTSMQWRKGKSVWALRQASVRAMQLTSSSDMVYSSSTGDQNVSSQGYEIRLGMKCTGMASTFGNQSSSVWRRQSSQDQSWASDSSTEAAHVPRPCTRRVEDKARVPAPGAH